MTSQECCHKATTHVNYNSDMGCFSRAAALLYTNTIIKEEPVHPIKRLRTALGWSQAELSRRSGVHPTTISQIESRRLVPYLAQILKLSAALGADINTLRQEIQVNTDEPS